MNAKWTNSFLIAGMALAVAACQHASKSSGSDVAADHDHAAGLELNQGRKWVVDEPMMVHIRSMEKAVRDFETAPVQDHEQLALAVQNDLGRLVTKCTMTGKAHDELHKWLMPFLGLSAEYVKATERGVQEQKYHQIQEALVVFNRYFE